MMSDTKSERRMILNIGVIQVAMLFITLVSLFASLLEVTDPLYRFSFLQPLAFGIGLLAFQKSWKFTFAKVSGALIFATYFVRMSLLPLLAVLGSHASFIPEGSLNAESYAIANFLSVYEYFVVGVFLMSRAKNSCGSICDNYAFPLTNRQTPLLAQRVPFLLKVIIVGMVVYMLCIFMSDSTVIRQNFSLLVGTPKGWYVRVAYRSIYDKTGKGLLGVLVTLTVYVFWYIQAIVPPVLLIRIRERRMSGSAKTLAILVIAFLLFMITSGTKMHSLECGFSFLMLVYLCYAEKYENAIKRIAIIGAIAAVFGVMAKSGLDGYGFENLNKVLSAYFGGVQNIAASIYTVNHFDGFGIKNVFPDIVNQIPLFGNKLKSVLHLGNTTNYLFNHSLTGGASLGQIIPAVGQGYSYFGAVLSPIVPLIAAALADHFDSKAMQSDNLILKNIYLIAAIMMSRAVVTTNMMSAVIYLVNTYVTLLIVYLGYGRIMIKRKL